MTNTFGITINGTHTDTSKTLKGAKHYATRNGYKDVSIRYNCGYIAAIIATKVKGKWEVVNPS